MSTLQKLIQQRDALLAERDALRDELNKPNAKRQKRNNNTTTPTTKKRSLATYNHAKSLLSEHSRLPVLDMDLRLRYISLTCPWLSVESVEKKVLKNGTTKVDILLEFKTCAKFNILMTIARAKNTDSEYIKTLKITPVTPITIAEATVVKALIESAQLSGNISSFVYTLNSILRLRHKRKHTFTEIIHAMELDPEKLELINDHPITSSTNPENLSHILFDHSPATFTVKTRSGETISITWKITVSTSSAHALSDFVVYKTSLNSTPNSMSLTKLFKSLIQANDVKTATLQLLHTL